MKKSQSVVTLSLSDLLAYTRQISEGLTGVLTLAQKSATATRSESATRAVADVARPSGTTHANKQTHLREMTHHSEEGTRAEWAEAHEENMAALNASRRQTRNNTRPASVSDDTPHVTIPGVHPETGKETYRVRLPKALFDAGEGQIFPYILLTLPNGEEKQIDCDAEGRSRCPKEWLGEVGQIAYFHATEPGVYTVSVSDGDPYAYTEGQPDPLPTRPAARRPSAAVTRALDLAFATAPVKPATRKRPARPATQAQLDARARFATQNRVVTCGNPACEARVKIGETVETARLGRICADCVSHYKRAERETRPTRVDPRADAREQVAALRRGSLPNGAQTAADRALGSVLRPRPVGR